MFGIYFIFKIFPLTLEDHSSHLISLLRSHSSEGPLTASSLSTRPIRLCFHILLELDQLTKGLLAKVNRSQFPTNAPSWQGLKQKAAHFPFLEGTLVCDSCNHTWILLSPRRLSLLRCFCCCVYLFPLSNCCFGRGFSFGTFSLCTINSMSVTTTNPIA